MATNELTKQETQVSPSERFTTMVMNEYQSLGAYDFTMKEKQLIRGYFITIDQMLQKVEADRVRKNSTNKNHSYDNDLPYKWSTIDLPQLAQDLAHFAHIGLDMMEDNTLFPIPYKDNKGQKYTITLMEGYNGKRYQAEKYALTPFKNVVVEVVYSNDKFRPIKKSATNPIESYEFEINNPFDRGEPIGVFGYIEFEDSARNKLVIMSKAEVMKRKPKYASPEFWGGKKKTYENGKQVEVEVEGWLPQMFEKTMKREIYGSKNIPRDPAKIDESYNYIKSREAQYAEIATNAAVEAEVLESGNKQAIEIPVDFVEDTPEQAEPIKQEKTLQPEQQSMDLPFNDDEGPGF